MRMKEINKKRTALRTEINQPMKEVDSIEGQYWQQSQARLEKVTNDDPTGSIGVWGRTFAVEEKQFLDDRITVSSLEASNEHAPTKQEELMAADREFWGIWRKQLDFLSDLPPQVVPDAAGQPTNTGDAIMSSPNPTKKRKISSARSESRPMLTLATPASEAADAHGHSLSPTTTQALKSIAAQPPRSPGPFGAPSPISLASSPDPTIPPSGLFSKPRYPASKRRKTSAAEPTIKPAFTPINSPKPSPQPLPKQLGSTPITSDITSDTSVATESPQNDSGFQGVTDLVVGEIYQAYYKDATQEGWWMCTPLPWDDWEAEIGVDMDFTRADMWRDLPRQYKTGKGRRKKAILGWKGQYQDGGNKVMQRVFPVLFFDDVDGAPGNLQFNPGDPMETYTFPQQAMEALPTEWVAAKNVRVPGDAAAAGVPVYGADTAGRFRERFLARRVRREEGR